MSGIVTEGNESFDGAAGSSMEELSSRRWSHLSHPVEEVPSTKHFQKGMRTLALDTSDHAPDAIMNSQAKFINRRGRLRGGTMRATPRIAKGHDAAGEIIVRGKPNVRQVVRVTRSGIPINSGGRAQPPAGHGASNSQDDNLLRPWESKGHFFADSLRVAKMLDYEYQLKFSFFRAFSELGGENPEALLKMVTENKQAEIAKRKRRAGLGDVIWTLEMVECLIGAFHDGLESWEWSYDLHAHLVQVIEKLGGDPFDGRVTRKSVLELMEAKDFRVENDVVTSDLVGLHLSILRQVWKEVPVDSYCPAMIVRTEKIGKAR